MKLKSEILIRGLALCADGWLRRGLASPRVATLSRGLSELSEVKKW